jgi:hypothetical protein
MSTLAFGVAVLLLAATPAAEPRPFHEIDRELTAALRQESVAANLADRGAAVHQIARLFTELDRDPRLLTSPTLQEHRARARGRLVNVQKDLLRDIAKAEKQRKHKRPSGQASHAESALRAASADAEQRELAAALAAEVSLAGYATGGPAHFFQAAQGGGAVGDYGEELVDLITRTIFPDKWEVNGGVSTIVYYRPLMCLVVTATGTTHGDVENLLDGLRAAGR